ncbi:hypothetical protein PHMEG_00020702 [Phytophthora megakarya]|uniref:Uncharacterized protein n=1 Tax=Phytophthora megakarya TaxID=4795 RepID=A0A225VQA6_9STRA|nr:hypothetical protein PHMEG_00020702 [Phytophthora megakarya]
MGKATEVVAPTPPVVVEEHPNPVEEPPGPKTLISLEQLEHFHAAESAAERVDRLQNALGVQHYQVNPCTSVWVDFCFGVLNFARDKACLPLEKTLILLTLAHEIYEFASQLLVGAESPLRLTVSKISEPVPPSSPDLQDDTSTAKEAISTQARHTFPAAYPSIEAVYDQFREKIGHVSGVVTSNDNSGNVDTSSAAPTPFSPGEVAQVVAFFTSTFFRHLGAYQYISRVPRPSVVREVSMPIEIPLHPGTLADATLHAE